MRSLHQGVRLFVSQFSTVLSYTLLFSVQYWSKLCTAFTSRTSTVLGRFYYGISRHSTQISSSLSCLPIPSWWHLTFLFLYWVTCRVRTNVNNLYKVAPNHSANATLQSNPSISKLSPTLEHICFRFCSLFILHY